MPNHKILVVDDSTTDYLYVQSILADWGNQRQYIVDDINFELTPGTYKFECRGQMMSLGEYFS